MGKTKLDEILIFKISISLRIFYVTIGIKIPFFRVSVCDFAGSLLTTVRYHELFDEGLRA